MERVVISEKWQDFLAEVGLKSFDDFFYYPGKERLSATSNRDVHKISLGENENQKTFFIKRFHDPQLSDIISSLYNFGSIKTQAAIEWDNANLLLSHNIGTYIPVCFGERKKFGIESKSFIITEKLETEFKEFVTEKWLSLERTLQEKIIISIATLVRQMHDLNISFTDLYMWHIFIDRSSLEKDCRLSIIDLHRMKQNVTNKNEKIKNIGRLFWSLSPKYFDDKILDLFISTYVKDGYEADKNQIAAQIQKRVDIISKRKKRKEY
ncbi:MAG: hypothetical protein FVQ80_08045 [Planctomycetes bacterium]|nr:hypothetical protein [Planctomycetota bacterium]